MPTLRRPWASTPTSSRSPTRTRRRSSARCSRNRGNPRPANAPDAPPRPPPTAERDSGRQPTPLRRPCRRRRRLGPSSLPSLPPFGGAQRLGSRATPNSVPITAACARHGLHVADHVAVVAKRCRWLGGPAPGAIVGLLGGSPCGSARLRRWGPLHTARCRGRRALVGGHSRPVLPLVGVDVHDLLALLGFCHDGDHLLSSQAISWEV